MSSKDHTDLVFPGALLNAHNTRAGPEELALESGTPIWDMDAPGGYSTLSFFK